MILRTQGVDSNQLVEKILLQFQKMSFQPKQKKTRYEATHLAELQGDFSKRDIKYTLGPIPSFSPGGVIHDNACGTGAVMQAIMELKPVNISIDTTDINLQIVAG
jgi:hypothetical protein